jgi:multiple sugar transport system substrate-binding protein
MSTERRTFRIAVRAFPPFEQAIRLQWESFEEKAQTGLELDLVALDLHALEDALFTSGGMSSGDWDCAFVNTDWIAAMHALGCAVDLAPLLQAEPPQDYPGGWTDSLLRLQKIDGAVLGVPYHDGPECLILRSDLFRDETNRKRFHERFGRELEAPKTWAEFHETARFFHDEAAGISGTVFAAFPDGHNTVYDFLLQLWSRGGELFDQDGKLQFKTDAAIEALEFYRTIVTDHGAVPCDCAGLDSVAAGQRFADGKVAMMVNWFGFAAYSHASDDSAVRGKVEIAPIPAGTHGASVSLNVYWMLSLPVGSPYWQKGWDFLRHALTPEMDLVTSTSGAIGCRRSTWNNAALNARIPFYHQLEDLHRGAREIPQRADWPQIAVAIDQLMTAAATTETPVDTLLAQADEAFR